MKQGHPIRSAVFFGVAVALAALVIGYAFWAKSQQTKQSAEEARLNAASLCVIQNENRETTRLNTAALYTLLTSYLRQTPHAPPTTARRIAEQQAKVLKQQLKALRPINCSNYVQPTFIPPETVQSPTTEGP